MTSPQNDELAANESRTVGSRNTSISDARAPKSPPRYWLLVLLVLVIVGGLFGNNFWRQARQRISSDDAYLTANITQIAPQVSGTVTHIYVQDDGMVKPGQLLVTLDPSTYQADVEQAQATLQSAIAQAQGAAISVSLAGETGSAQITQAQGGVGQAASNISSAVADVQRANAGVEKAVAGAQAATANIGTAQAAVEAAQANKKRAQADVDTALAQVTTAQANVQALQAAVAAAQATADKAARDADRYATMLKEGAVSRTVADQAAVAARVAQAQVESAVQQVAMAQAAVSARETEVTAAREQVESNQAAVGQAQAALAAARDSAQASQADVSQAEAQRQASLQAVRQAGARRQQTLGQLQQAHTRPKQIALSVSARAQAEAKVAQARAALHAAQLQLKHTKIYAPVAGMVSQKTVEVGALVQPGTPLMALTQTNQLWVVANYKETQLAHIHPGQRAEVLVDALNGQRFTGHVGSIAAGTGSTFALLPPDNATGNFTKVIQRVPIRILLDPRQPGLQRLRAGLSVEATIIAP